MSSTSTDTRIITIESKDKVQFQVSREVLRRIGTFEDMYKVMNYDEDLSKEIEIFPAQNVEGKILGMIVKFLEHHINDPEPSEEDKKKDKRAIPLPEWDRDFVPKDQYDLAALYEASNYLNIQKLMDVCAQYIAGLIQGRSTTEIGNIFGIECDVTPAEQEQIRKENAWCED